MKSKNFFLNRLFPFMCVVVITGNYLIATTYVSTASSSYTGTLVDSYQTSATSLVGPGSTSYTLASGDTLQGLFVFTGGLTFPSGTLNWAAKGVVDGTLTLGSSGVLNLQSDLNLGPNGAISASSAFTINAGNNGYGIILEGSGAVIKQPVTVSKNLIIDGFGHQCAVQGSGGFVGGSTPKLTLRNMKLIVPSINDRLFGASSTSLPTTLENVGLHLSSTTSLMSNVSNTLTVSGCVRIEGYGNRVSVGAPLIIGKHSTLYVGKGVTLTNIPSITMADQTSILHLDGCQLYTGNDADGTALTAGFTFSTGTLVFENQVNIYNRNYQYGGAANADMTKAFIIGGSGASNYANVIVLGGAYVTVDGCMEYVQS